MSAPPTVVEVPLRWSDLDAYGHVNNATVLTLLEEARIRALEVWFGGNEVLDEGILVASQEIDYLAQVSYQPSVEAHVWCTDIGAAKFTVAYELKAASDRGGVRYAVAEATLVTYDVAAGRVRRLPERARSVLQDRLGDPAPLHRRHRGRRA